jgi:muramoyltetrapeptide carboxypeptidase LdcA involved in peptidoglycan recycling
MYPFKLKSGQKIRIIAPSKSASLVKEEHLALAKERFRSLGITVTYSEHAFECDEFFSSSIEARISDIHAAFEDQSVNAIFAIIGGENANQLLRYLDYELIKRNPKIFCGYSDITALTNAIYCKTGLVGYSGPNYAGFGMLHGFEYTLEYLQKCLFQSDSYEIAPSTNWSDDAWYKEDQNKRDFLQNEGWAVLNEGEAEGISLGGNLCTFNLLQGTEFMPDLNHSILFIEDDFLVSPQTFDRDLQSLIHQTSFQGVKGILIGRFQKKSEMTLQLLSKIINTKKELKHIPVIANIDFGHTTPQVTLPIGGEIYMNAYAGSARIIVKKH